MELYPVCISLFFLLIRLHLTGVFCACWQAKAVYHRFKDIVYAVALCMSHFIINVV